MTKYVKAKNLLGVNDDPAELFSLIDELDERFANVQLDIEENRKLFHKLSPPVINKPYEDCQKWQSDVPRQVFKDLLARMTENDAIISAKSVKGTATLTDAATRLSIVLMQMWQIAQDKTGQDIPGAICAGQVIDKYAVLHWDRCDHLWPALPERLYYGEGEMPKEPKAKDEDDEAYEKRRSYERNPAYRVNAPDLEPTGRDDEEVMEFKAQSRRKNKAYREKYQAYRDRVLRAQAEAGSPYYFETINPAMVRFVPDRSVESGYGMVMTRRTVAKLDYLDALIAERNKQDGEYEPISLAEVDAKIPVYAEQEAPEHYLPSFGNYGPKVTVFELWTRDEVYEVCGDEHGQSKVLVKSDKHLWKMPTFVLIPAVDTHSSDWVQRYQPALQGVYDQLPGFNRLITLFMLIAEMIATPVWYYREVKTGRPKSLPDGSVQKLSRDSALASFAPDGYEIAKLDYDMDPAFMELIGFVREELEKAKPQAGQAEVTSGTEPWAIRLQQAQASIEPGMLVKSKDNAVQIVMRSVAGDMSLKPEDGGLRAPVAVFARTEDGAVNYDEIVSVEPDEIKSLDIRVSTSNVSAPERVTLVQLGLQLLGPPDAGGHFTQGTITLEEFFRDYALKENPQEAVAMLRASQLFEKYLMPAIEKQELAQWAGTEVVLGPNGDMIGMGGQTTDPASVLAMNGAQAAPNPTAQQGTGMLSSARQMPPLSDLNVPETAPVQGRP